MGCLVQRWVHWTGLQNFWLTRVEPGGVPLGLGRSLCPQELGETEAFLGAGG